jgi:hypothetical protein
MGRALAAVGEQRSLRRVCARACVCVCVCVCVLITQPWKVFLRTQGLVWERYLSVGETLKFTLKTSLLTFCNLCMDTELLSITHNK